MLFVLQNGLPAATLQPESLAAWTAYTQAASSKMQQRAQPGGQPFLRLDEITGVAERIHAGELLVAPLGRVPLRVAGALVHDWLGIAFVPNAKMDDVLSTARDYWHYAEFYHPAVVESKLLKNDSLTDRFSILLVNKALVSKTALAGEFETTYIRVDEHRWYSISETVRMQEVESYGTPQQRLLAQNEGSGLIWRLYSITSFEERDGGVYMELEAMALSREIPPSLRWIATPIVRRVSRNSILTSLQQTTQAVCSRTTLSARLPNRSNTVGHLSPPPGNGPISFH